MVGWAVGREALLAESVALVAKVVQVVAWDAVASAGNAVADRAVEVSETGSGAEMEEGRDSTTANLHINVVDFATETKAAGAVEDVEGGEMAV